MQLGPVLGQIKLIWFLTTCVSDIRADIFPDGLRF
jgi:hypothetical protein